MMWCFVFVIYMGFSYQGVMPEFINRDELAKGFCHYETKVIKKNLTCDVKEIKVAVEDEANIINYCSFGKKGMQCSHGTFNAIHQALKFSFKFNHEIHAGKQLWVNSTCQNGSSFNESTRLYPCLSGFTATGYHNNTHAFLTCKHSFFNLSRGITIINKESRNLIQHCEWNKENAMPQCQMRIQGHKNGIENHITDYAEGFQCIMDGQTIDIRMEKVTTTTGNLVSVPVSGLPSVPNVTPQENKMSGGGNGTANFSPSQIVFLLSLLLAYYMQDFIDFGLLLPR